MLGLLPQYLVTMSTLQPQHVCCGTPLPPPLQLAVPIKETLGNYLKGYSNHGAHNHTPIVCSVYCNILADVLAREAFYESVCRIFPPESLL